MLAIQNDYGTFYDDGREYLITRPDTPRPWINVISNGDYGFVLSQAGSGYSWRTHASLNRITRWEQDLIRDEWGKYLYLRDAESGEYWSASWQPCGARLEDYRVRHGMGYSVITAHYGAIASRITCFVPLGEPCEIWLLHLENQSDQHRHLQVFTYFEWLLGAAPDWHREFHKTFIETRYLASQGALLATKVLWDLPVESGPHWNLPWPYVAFHSSSVAPDGYDSYKRAFLGRHGSLHAPQAVVRGTSQGTQGRYGDPIGSLQLKLSLAPQQAIDVVFCLGAADDEDQAIALVERYKDLSVAQNAFDVARGFWREHTSRLTVQTPEPAVDVLANGWLAYQAISGRLWGRTAYYQTGGAYGFRDQLQDSLVWLLLDQPERTLEQIRLHAAHQFQEGIVLHWWHPLAESGLRSEYSDDLLWLPFVLLHYLVETGDLSALDEDVPFYDEGSASLYEHCLRAFEVALRRRSERGLPLILKGDWNDGLNAVGDEGKGESVWMAHFLYFLLEKWAELPVLNEETRDRFRREAEALRQAANRHGWDGEWYLRATTDEGKLIGSAQNDEGRIFLNAQTWSVISGLAPEERAREVMESARKHLYTSYGALLFAPAYTRPNSEIGYLSRYAPGVRENGGVYVHAACWSVLAERKVQGVNAAYQLWRSFCPPLRAQDPDQYMVEPYVMPGNVEGPASQFSSRGGWTWYTGSAAWYLRALIEGVLGVSARFEGLYLDAGLPDGWGEFRLTRRFRGATYDIHVRRAADGELAGYEIDGESYDSNLLPIFPAGTQHTVEILI